MKYILGSHNSLSFSGAAKWYLKPFTFVAKCQSKTLKEQFYEYKVRYFDIRITFDKRNNIRSSHGSMIWKYDVEQALSELNHMARNAYEPVYVRLVLECNSESKRQEKLDDLFIQYCMHFQSMYPYLLFVGGRRKYDWKKLVEFNTEEPSLDDKYSSTTSPFGPKKNNFWDKIDDWWPWLYAATHNKKIRRKGTDKDVLFLDYINIGV